MLAGFYTPDDGRVNPVDVTMALARGRTDPGSHPPRRLPATDVLVRGGAVAGVRTLSATSSAST